jgi:hypothetical protein
MRGRPVAFYAYLGFQHARHLTESDALRDAARKEIARTCDDRVGGLGDTSYRARLADDPLSAALAITFIGTQRLQERLFSQVDVRALSAPVSPPAVCRAAGSGPS